MTDEAGDTTTASEVDFDSRIARLIDRKGREGQVVDDRTIPGRDAETRSVEVEQRLESALGDRGIDSLYAHQADAVDAIRDGDHVVLATQTASGKSLAYTVPAFEAAMDHGGRTLYLGPQTALIADQTQTLSDLAFDLGFASGVHVAEYTGRTDDTDRKQVRDQQPSFVLSTPDMLHYALLPHAHRLWEWFFSTLDYVVLDELHEYRGVFGSHVSLVLRRLRRVCDRFDADPQFICCSATIGNPIDHASNVTGAPPDDFTLIDTDTSPSGPTRWLTWNPPEQSGGEGRRRSHHVETKELFVDLVADGFQTLTFTRSRQTAERYATDSADALRGQGDADLADRIGAYQAALTDDKRRDLESRLLEGALRGVWSTNALELGVDVGGLDAVILDGYPGTRMNSFQRAGRAGRGTDPSLVVMVAGEDQLDQYVATPPDDFFDGDPEVAVVDPGNEQVLDDHVRCAARENWLSPADSESFPNFETRVATLVSQGELERRDTQHGPRWTYAGDGSPQHEMNLRTIDDQSVDLKDGTTTIATLPLSDALRDAHPGAIYHHQGRTYEIGDLDLDRGRASLNPTWADHYTSVLTDKDITIQDVIEERHPLPRRDVPVRFAAIDLAEQITGYERKDGKSGAPMGTMTLDLPEQTLNTKALYYTIPEDIEAEIRADYDFPGSIHAAEHATISLFPTEVLCDRGDIGGLSTPLHPQTGQSTIFIYDGHPGGVGLTRSGFDSITDLLHTTLDLLDSCDCADGCPACVQSPQCGNANDPLDKHGAAALLRRVLETE